MNKQSPTFNSIIAGIPCGILVTHYHVTPPWRGSVYTCPSDLDYYGYTEFEYVVLDRKGYQADWLANKITDEDDERIFNEFLEYLKRYGDGI